MLARRYTACYKKYLDQVLNEVMVRMGVSSFVIARAVIELLRKELHCRKDIAMSMIYNVRLRGRKRTLELDDANIDIDPKHFNISFITDCKEAADNYFEGNFVIFMYVYIYIYIYIYIIINVCMMMFLLFVSSLSHV